MLPVASGIPSQVCAPQRDLAREQSEAASSVSATTVSAGSAIPHQPGPCNHQPIYHVAIVGGGSRGLGLLEQLLTRLATFRPPSMPAEAQLHVHMVDPGEMGEGLHHSDQPEHLLLNTAANQITFWPEPREGEPTGPSLGDWARQAGYRVVDGHVVHSPDGKGGDIAPGEILPRCLAGAYLHDVYRMLLQRLPIDGGPDVKIIHHRAEAVDLHRRPNGRLHLCLSNDTQMTVNYAVLTTGQRCPGPSPEEAQLAAQVQAARLANPRLGLFTEPYPVQQLDAIPSDATVGIRGISLTAHDVVSQLTVGRGGRFVDTAEGMRYQPSGNEPRIVMYARSGYPVGARPQNEKPPGQRDQLHFLTTERVEAMRAERGPNAQLDFRDDILPLMHREMCYAYHRAVASDPSRVPAPEDYRPSPGERMMVDALLWGPREQVFRDGQDFVEHVMKYLAVDLEQANRGNVSAPSKAAVDVLREIRGVLRDVVEFSGLTPESHKEFISMARRFNQLAGAPPKVRNEQLIALMHAGVVELGPGPNPDVSFDAERASFVLRSRNLEQPAETLVDVLVHAQVANFSPLTDDSPLFKNMLQRGMVRPYYNGPYHPGGVDIDHSLRVVAANGVAHHDMAAAGVVVEGPHFFTGILPGPGCNSRPVEDARRITTDIVLKMTRQFVLDAMRAASQRLRGQGYTRPRDQRQIVLHGNSISFEDVLALARAGDAQGNIIRLAPGTRHEYAYRVRDVRDGLELRHAMGRFRHEVRADCDVLPMRPLEEVGIVIPDVDELYDGAVLSPAMRKMLETFRTHGAGVAMVTQAHISPDGTVTHAVPGRPLFTHSGARSRVSQLCESARLPHQRFPVVLGDRNHNAGMFGEAQRRGGLGFALHGTPAAEKAANASVHNADADAVPNFFVRM
jgi:uncharacterized NAD(P)/FAD-binding protein YdhS